MSDLIWPPDRQFALILSVFPLAHGVSGDDNRKVISEIIHAIRNDLLLARCFKHVRPRRRY